jgi:hypothetical protein
MVETPKYKKKSLFAPSKNPKNLMKIEENVFSDRSRKDQDTKPL